MRRRESVYSDLQEIILLDVLDVCLSEVRSSPHPLTHNPLYGYMFQPMDLYLCINLSDAEKTIERQ